MSGYASEATRRALRNRRRRETQEFWAATGTHRVVRVQKNGKRPAQSDLNGVCVFTEEKAKELCARWNDLNPSMKFEVEKI